MCADAAGPDARPDREAAVTRSDRRRLGAIVAVAVVAVAAVAVAVIGSRRGPAPTPSGPAPTTIAVAGSGPRAYYAVTVGRGASLYERVLDGHSLPRLVATQPGTTSGRIFEVSPDGTWALIVASVVDRAMGQATTIARVRVSDGTREPLGMVAGTAEDGVGVWSADGAAFATTVDDPTTGGRVVLIVDIASGRLTRVPIKQQQPLLFEDRTRLLLEQPVIDPLTGEDRTWRVERIDSTTGEVVPVAFVGLTGPTTTAAANDVSFAIGAAIQVRSVPDTRSGPTGELVLHDLRTDSERTIAPVDDVSWLAFTPDSATIVVCGPRALQAIAIDGTTRDLVRDRSFDCLEGGVFSAGGGLVGVSTWDDRSILRVVDVATARVAILPLPDPIAEAHLVALVGETLPDQPLPPVADPAPAPAPSGGLAVAGAPTLTRVQVTVAPDGTPSVHAERLTAGASGGLTTVATMPPIPMPEAKGRSVQASGIRDPTGDGVVIVVRWDTEGRVWRWHDDGRRERLATPPGFPVGGDLPVIAPDGRHLATTASGRDGPVIAIWDLHAGALRAVPMPRQYDRVEGWPRADRIRVATASVRRDAPGGTPTRCSWIRAPDAPGRSPATGRVTASRSMSWSSMMPRRSRWTPSTRTRSTTVTSPGRRRCRRSTAGRRARTGI